MFKLVIQDDEGKTTVVPLIRDEITIGRKEGNTIRLTERNVSRRHARILRSNNEVQIEDLGSYNGIRVNNARIAERVSLRISDQVQIGDYKLYLKAEGVEQVDDARTMPIERIENVGATEVMPAVSGTANTPTAPIAAAAPGARALGVADTDPSARPVATPAQVAALTAVTGYGKLVVLSSNFAGKEFELTRPQMIVGRTDENDLVVNHRSISRNHAKITRDTDTQRYTISDLQSSNGVRVNGQDYGKVELRRGDVVDLGHVRLRFVEPGEDFVFARDAQIADVEGTGGKRGAMIAIVLAVVVLGAVAAYFALKSNGGNADKNGGVVNGSGGSDLVAVGSGGSGSATAVIPDTIDAAAAVVPTGDDAKRIAADCQTAVVERNWTSVNVCADKLAQFDPAAAQEFRNRAHAEVKNDATKDKVDQAIADQNLVKAKKLLGDIPEASVYKKDTEAEVDALENKLLDDFKTRAAANKAANKCKDNDILIAQAIEKTPKAADLLKPYKCAVAIAVPEDCSSVLRNETKACHTQFCNKNPDSPKCATAVAAPACNADDLLAAGTAAVARGDHAVAVQNYDSALKCKYDVHTLQLSFMAACRANKVDYARKYWKRMSSDMKSHLLQMCLHEHITQEQLDQ